MYQQYNYNYTGIISIMHLKYQKWNYFSNSWTTLIIDNVCVYQAYNMIFFYVKIYLEKWLVTISCQINSVEENITVFPIQ